MHTQLMIMAYNFPNTNACFGSSPVAYGNGTSFDADFFEFTDWFDEDVPAFTSDYNPQDHLSYSPNGAFAASGNTTNSTLLCDQAAVSNSKQLNIGNYGSGREKVAFRTKSEIEVLNDGFKWRKYGKKMVKNSRNPRNYYKCSVEGCPVKKRVERDNEDRRYVVTTYEGIHNHEGPTI